MNGENQKPTRACRSVLAGETRLEHATDGFGDRCSTIELLPCALPIIHKSCAHVKNFFDKIGNFFSDSCFDKPLLMLCLKVEMAHRPADDAAVSDGENGSDMVWSPIDRCDAVDLKGSAVCPHDLFGDHAPFGRKFCIDCDIHSLVFHISILRKIHQKNGFWPLFSLLCHA